MHVSYLMIRRLLRTPCFSSPLHFCREVQEIQARVGDEAWVPSTRLYGTVQQQLVQLNEAVGARVREAEALARERDEALREAATKASLSAVRSSAKVWNMWMGRYVTYPPTAPTLWRERAFGGFMEWIHR